MGWRRRRGGRLWRPAIGALRRLKPKHNRAVRDFRDYVATSYRVCQHWNEPGRNRPAGRKSLAQRFSAG